MTTTNATHGDTTVLIYTNAPKVYDYPYTAEVSARAGIDSANKVWRCVRMPRDRVDAQTGRYQSGWHAALPPHDWQRALLLATIVRPGGAS